MSAKIKVWNEDRIRILTDNYPNIGRDETAKLLGLSNGSVDHKASRLGLRVTPERKSAAQSKAAITYWLSGGKKRRVNADFFVNIERPEIAYAMGFIWADGSFNCKSQHFRVSLEIASKDAASVKRCLKISGKWYSTIRKRSPERQPITLMLTTQMKLFKRFMELDYGRKSSASPTIVLKAVPPHIRHYWWRGFFDGDGCVYATPDHYAISFAGTYTQDWIDLYQLCDDIGVKCTTRRWISRKGHKSSAVRITGIEATMKMRKYLYPDGADLRIGLKRKQKILFSIAYKQTPRHEIGANSAVLK